MMRAGLYRPVHVKALRSQKLRMLLTHRKLLQSKAIAIDNDLRGTLAQLRPQGRNGRKGEVRSPHPGACREHPRLGGTGGARQRQGIIVRESLQPTSATKSATFGLTDRSKEQATDYHINPKRGNQNGGGFGCEGFGPNARAMSRWGRSTLERASCRAYSWSPTFLYCGLVSDARNATTSSISDSVSANGCMSSSSQGSLTPSPLL